MNTPNYGNAATLAMLSRLNNEPTNARFNNVKSSKLKKPKDISGRQWKKMRKAARRNEN